MFRGVKQRAHVPPARNQNPLLDQVEEAFGGTFEAALLGPEPKFVAVTGWARVPNQPIKLRLWKQEDPKKGRVSALKRNTEVI